MRRSGYPIGRAFFRPILPWKERLHAGGSPGESQSDRGSFLYI